MIRKLKLIVFAVLLLSMLLSACGIAAAAEPTQTPVIIQVEVTRLVEQTVVVAEIVEKIITATPQPQTPTLPVPIVQEDPSTTGLPTAALPEMPMVGTPPAAPAASMGDVTFWCTPDTGSGIPAVQQYVSAPPANAVWAKMVNGRVEYAGKFLICQFAYNFNQPVPAGAQLQVKDTSNSPPWLTQQFAPSPENGNVGYVILSHAMLVQPPLWEALYHFTVSSSAQPTIWSSLVHYDRGWRPEPCWNGTWPNPVTMACPKQQDCHPSDIGYTPMPPIDEE
ncbi:MAG: hypothetical protein HPY45_04210 [Anaerolineae bacterium]|nr:hypothetical protein [Anaerolineae bacterium]